MDKTGSKTIKKNLLGLINNLKQPLIATIFGLAMGAIIIIASNENPISVYMNMFNKAFFSPYYLMQTLARATPIIICSIAIAASWRAGYINLGVEGQMIVGSFVAIIAALNMPGPPILVQIVSIILGMIAGALYALIAALLNNKYGVSMVICTLMTNYIASHIVSYFVNYPFKDKEGSSLAIQTARLDEAMRFMKLKEGTSLNTGFIIAIIIVLLFIFISKKTIFGYESKMTGFNPLFAQYGGVKQRSTMFKTMALSGAIATLAGVMEIYGVKYRYIDGMFTSTEYAWTGLMSALIANLNPIGMFFTSIFLSGLQVGGSSIQHSSNVPLKASSVIQASITLFVSVKFTFSFVKNRRKLRAKKNAEEEVK